MRKFTEEEMEKIISQFCEKEERKHRRKYRKRGQLWTLPLIIIWQRSVMTSLRGIPVCAEAGRGEEDLRRTFGKRRAVELLPI